MEEKLVTDQLLSEETSETTDSQLPIVDPENENISFGDVTEEAVMTGEINIGQDENSPDGEPAQEPEQELTELEKLTQKRTGFWQLNLKEPDVKWIKNACNGKFEFSGPNEAFMLMNCYIGFSSAHSRMTPANGEEAQPCVVQASAIEACAYFMNRVGGNNLESAERVFRIAMALNPVIMEMRTLDNLIAPLRKAEEDKKKADQPETETQLQPAE